MLKPQSIRKGVQITLNGKEAEKQEVIEMSKDWTVNQETLFKPSTSPISNAISMKSNSNWTDK